MLFDVTIEFGADGLIDVASYLVTADDDEHAQDKAFALLCQDYGADFDSLAYIVNRRL